MAAPKRSGRPVPKRAAPLLLLLTLLVLPPAVAPAAGPAGLAAQEGPPTEPPPEWGPVSITMEGVEYPAPVHFLDFSLYGQDVRMAYMDVEPTGASNGRTVVLLHGFNFFGEYFHNQIEALTAEGFRVVVPDRIGFGKSSKPYIPYRISLMADNTRRLLDHLDLERVAVVGHSMGGMVATRFAYLFPERTSHLVLLNSIRLAEPEPGGGWMDVEARYRNSLEPDFDAVLYQRGYYVTEWQTEWEKYMRIHWGWRQSGGWHRMARVRALLGEALSGYVPFHDWPYIEAPALVTGGAEDGENYREQVRVAAERLPNGRAELIPGIGHNAHFVVPDRVHDILVPFLTSAGETD